MAFNADTLGPDLGSYAASRPHTSVSCRTPERLSRNHAVHEAIDMPNHNRRSLFNLSRGDLLFVPRLLRECDGDLPSRRGKSSHHNIGYLARGLNAFAPDFRTRYISLSGANRPAPQPPPSPAGSVGIVQGKRQRVLSVCRRSPGNEIDSRSNYRLLPGALPGIRCIARSDFFLTGCDQPDNFFPPYVFLEFSA